MELEYRVKELEGQRMGCVSILLILAFAIFLELLAIWYIDGVMKRFENLEKHTNTPKPQQQTFGDFISQPWEKP